MVVLKAAAFFVVAAIWAASPPFFPVGEIRPGLRGIGKTVFSGNRIEEFGVEILGVLENAGPKQSIILARLTGAQAEASGVLQGMSGSPVYIGGRLLGAVAMAFPFSKEPLAGIRPIGEMVDAAAAPPNSGGTRVSLGDRDLARVFPPAREFMAGNARMVDIATPLSFGGFTRRTIEEFSPRLRGLGLVASQGMSGGGNSGERLGNPQSLQPGSMISVQLLTGDLSLGAEGTVTHIDGTSLYAFGHQFLSVGATDLPFARAEVLALAPNLQSSFKISAAREWMGTITSDRSTAIAGQLGRRAAMVPVSIAVRAPAAAGGTSRNATYTMQMVSDRFLGPFLLQMAVYSALDATERTLGAGTAAVRGQVEFKDGVPPLRLDGMYADDANLPMLVAVNSAVPLGYVWQGGFDALKVTSVSIAIDVRDDKREWQIDQVWPSRRTVRPGEDLDLVIQFLGENGTENTRRMTYRVPVGTRAGTLNITVADGTTANFATYQHLAGMRMRSPGQLVNMLNTLRSSNSAYVKIWRHDTAFRVQGRLLPAPPASLMLMLGRGGPASAAAEMSDESEIDELRLGIGDAVVSGSRTVQVEVEE